MAQLLAIGYTALGGLGTITMTFSLFGLAVRSQSVNIAPRCSARSPDVIYNPVARRSKSNGMIFWWRKKKSVSEKEKSKGEDDVNNIPVKEHVQYRGSPVLGWIPWTLSLSYETLLNGVPGTGTRKGGMGGAMLKVNLDGIVLLRFHAVALRVVILATILTIGIILPMNLTAQCDDGIDHLDCDVIYNISNYEKTTIKNIPQWNYTRYDDDEFRLMTLVPNYFSTLLSGNIARLYIVVGISAIINYYTLHLLSKEWANALALRRVYYLESSHFENRRQELEETAEYMDDSSSDEENCDRKQSRGITWRRKINKASNKRDYSLKKNSSPKKKSNREQIRPPWIPHPEQRETVPNVELYSVLVGNIPSQPSEVIEGDDNIEAAFGATDDALHWQLEVATTFFDQCVPNQPGFSSSVAAVTILPDAPKLALAWRKWYRHVGLLRKLRFIRLLISEMRHYDINYDDEVSTVTGIGNTDYGKKRKRTLSEDIDKKRCKDESSSISLSNRQMFDDSAGHDLWKRMNYKYDVFGTDYEEDVVSLLVQAMNYGPEQTAVYSREFAQGASFCCPNGCAEERTRDLRIDELLELEMDVKRMVEASFDELQHAQIRNVSKKNKSKKGSTLTTKRTEATHESHVLSKTFMEEKKPSAEGDHTDRALVGMGAEMQNANKEMNMEVVLNEGQTLDVPEIDRKSQGSVEDIHAAKTYEIENKIGCVAPVQMNAIKLGSVRSDEKLFGDNDVMNELQPRQTSDLSDITSGKGTLAGNGSGRHTYRLKIPEELPVLHTSHLSNSVNDNQSHSTVQSSRLRRHVTMANNGKVYVRDRFNSVDEDESTPLYSIDPTRPDPNTPVRKNDRGFINYHNTDTNTMPNLTSTPSVSARRRFNTSLSLSSIDGRKSSDRTRSGKSGNNQWAQVEGITRTLPTGVWQKPEVKVKEVPHACVTSAKSWVKEWKTGLKDWFNKTKEDVVDDLASDATFAVVTFTSRQAAVAARQCLADGRGEGKWVPVRDIPVPPLADAAVCDFKTCRGCCRPVSLTMNPKHQLIRKIISWIILSIIYIFSTFVINLVASLIAPEKLYKVWPGLESIDNNPIISGIIPALLFSLFFALCPIIFRAIANFGSNAVSVSEAEFYALKYYWWFMLITAFFGTAIGSMVLNAINQSKFPTNNSLSYILLESAASLATQTSANWLNWIIFRTFLVLPLMYMLQINTYIFQWLGWKCCRRCVMGGGVGGPIPYRIYIDSGVVFLCTVALSPVAPLVAPAALLYFLYCAPLWRRNLIFMYRPKFDSGGVRWPFLSDIFMTSIFAAQILLTTVMVLRRAWGPASLAALSIIPPVLHRRAIRLRYLSSYNDAALLQTSQLDNWDASFGGSSEEGREQYRRFLVDGHKAAYVPICIAGGMSEALTAEPAVVVPHENDPIIQETNDEEISILQEREGDDESYGTVERPPSPMTVMTSTTTPRYIERANQQVGASLRRLPASVTGSFAADVSVSDSIRSRSFSANTGRPPRQFTA